MNAAPYLLDRKTTVTQDADRITGRVPHISVHAFCENPKTGVIITDAAEDRRLARAEMMVSDGGIAAAIAHCRNFAAPDLLVLESRAGRSQLLVQLAELASHCDPDTKVIVIGMVNDVALFRDLIECGITDYMVAPITTSELAATILRIFQTSKVARPGQVCAFIGAKGGVGSSTIAQNMAASIGEAGKVAVILADLDLQFGSVALNLNFQSGNNLAEQLGDAARLDDAVLDRLLVSRGRNLRVLASMPAALDSVQPGLDLLDKVIDLAQASFPYVVLDLPHVWSPWVKRAVIASDTLVITTQPDLGGLRNTKSLFDLLAGLRPNDQAPHLVLNQIGMPRRAEIKPAAFIKALQANKVTEIGFDAAAFSKASNAGQLLIENAPRAAACREFRQLAETLIGPAGMVKKSTGTGRFWARLATR